MNRDESSSTRIIFVGFDFICAIIFLQKNNIPHTVCHSQRDNLSESEIVAIVVSGHAALANDFTDVLSFLRDASQLDVTLKCGHSMEQNANTAAAGVAIEGGDVERKSIKLSLGGHIVLSKDGDRLGDQALIQGGVNRGHVGELVLQQQRVLGDLVHTFDQLGHNGLEEGLLSLDDLIVTTRVTHVVKLGSLKVGEQTEHILGNFYLDAGVNIEMSLLEGFLLCEGFFDLLCF